MSALNLHRPYLIPSAIGFDRLFDMINEMDVKKPQSYPPYNIIRFDEDNYQIQIAVAGFSPDELDIEVKENQLTVNGAIKSVYTSDVQFLHHGLASRDFSHTFKLSDTIVVKTADVENGVLKIDLQNIIPEEKKPRKIPIESKPLLTSEEC
jgi:molecular chaperone IbpA